VVEGCALLSSAPFCFPFCSLRGASEARLGLGSEGMWRNREVSKREGIGGFTVDGTRDVSFCVWVQCSSSSPAFSV